MSPNDCGKQMLFWIIGDCDFVHDFVYKSLFMNVHTTVSQIESRWMSWFEDKWTMLYPWNIDTYAYLMYKPAASPAIRSTGLLRRHWPCVRIKLPSLQPHSSCGRSTSQTRVVTLLLFTGRQSMKTNCSGGYKGVESRDDFSRAQPTLSTEPPE